MLNINFWIEEVEHLVKEGKSIRQAIEIVKKWRDDYKCQEQ